ncbi:MAG: phosphonate C-P lyase system protein PhnL [Desulfocurvibacter africanus]
MIDVKGLSKVFLLHNQGGVEIEALRDISLTVEAGECVALNGPSGSGKSTLLRSLYGNYKPSVGGIHLRHRDEMVDIAKACPRTIMDVRAATLGYVSQFLRVIPRVPALDVVAGALGPRGKDAQARDKARELLLRLNVPENLHSISPMTFSGGEQQRVNIARGFIRRSAILLLDEPTASLDARNRDVVVQLILEAKAEGTAIVGIFHDKEAERQVADRLFTLKQMGKVA